MKMVKRIVFTATAIMLALLMCMSFVGCNNGEDDNKANENEAANNDKNDKSDNEGGLFSVTYKNTVIELGADASAVLKKLGEPKETNFVASCGEGAGEQYVYEYSSAYIYTVKNGDSEMIDGIKLRDDSATTSRSLRIGSTKSDVISAYGEKELDRGHLVYMQDEYCIDFTVDDSGSVTGIELRTETK